MKQDDIIRMAREAGAAMIHSGEHALMGNFALETFFQKAYAAGAAAERKAIEPYWAQSIEYVKEAEREACAKTVEQCVWPKWAECGDKREVFATAIRARGNT